MVTNAVKPLPRTPRILGVLTVCLAVSTSACATHIDSAASRPMVPPPTARMPSVVVSTISFTGSGCTGIVTHDHWNDLNGNNIEDPGEPFGDTIIQAPEYVTATGRNKYAFFQCGRGVVIRVRFTVEMPEEVKSLTASATCTLEGTRAFMAQKMGMTPVDTLTPVAGTDDWEGYFRSTEPIETIEAFENLVWDWTMTVNGSQTFKAKTKISGIYLNAGDGRPG